MMKTKFMLSRLSLHPKFKWLGTFLFFLGLVLLIICDGIDAPEFLDVPVFSIFTAENFLEQHHLDSNNILDEILCVLTIIGGLIVLFSREPSEDEFIKSIRLQSLKTAVFWNYIILLICICFVYGFPFFHVLVAHMFSVLLFYIIIFHWKLYQIKNWQDEE